MHIFRGSAVALVTPFTQDGINFDTLAKLVDFQISNGTAGIVACGTTGEPPTMTKEEKREVIASCVKEAAGRVPVIAGTGGNNTANAVEDSIQAEKLGADALLVVTPYYNKCSQKGLVAHYYAIADAVGLPIIVYNVPSRTGVNVLPETMAKLGEHKNIVAIKDASNDIVQTVEYARLTHGKMDLLSGNDDQTVPILSMGGIGAISVVSNIAPKAMNDMVMEYLDGNIKKAMQIQMEYMPLVKALFSDVNPIPAKTALNMMGFEAGPLRLPLCEMSDGPKGALRETLASYGLI